MTRHTLPYLLTTAIIAIAAAYLWSIGRAPICTCGEIKFWYGDIMGAGNSQHLTDWYTPSHFLHGPIFYGIAWLVARRLSFGWRLVLATLVEAAWEVAENTDAVINLYREAGAIGYFGDAVINSVSDIGMMILGFWLASRLPIWVTLLIFVAFEGLTIWLIRDGLLFNIIMLAYPLDAIASWQNELWSTFGTPD